MKIVISLLIYNLFSEVLAWSFYDFSQSFLISIEKNNGTKSYCSSVAIEPWKVITAAHCIKDAKTIELIENFKAIDHFSKINIKLWRAHHGYNIRKSKFKKDIAVLILSTPLPFNLPFAIIGKVEKEAPIYRVGFGGRDGQNQRNIIWGQKLISIETNYIILKDQYAVSGDSGGPIFQLINGEFILVAIHSTRQGEKTLSPTLLNTNSFNF